MLQHIPQWLGHALDGVRAGMDKVAITGSSLAEPAGGGFASIDLASPAFPSGGRLPDRFTADGAGVSPPLVWRDPPAGTACLALLVEDADSPTPQPLVHAALWGLAPAAGTLVEGAITDPAERATSDGVDVGRNSYGRAEWLPPDPPTGHGEHRYVFQLFALDAGAVAPAEGWGRTALLEAIAGHVLAAGLLIGTYSRGQPAEIGPIGAAATA